MNTTSSSPTNLAVAHALAQLLERLERSTVPVNPDQYRAVVKRLETELRALQGDPALDMLLRACPAAAELYENLHYDVAGLCRSNLDLGLRAEIEVGNALKKLRTRH